MNRRVRNDKVRELVKAAVEAGWALSGPDGQGHLRLLPPDGGKPVMVSRTVVAQGRGIMNMRAALKRGGLDI